MGEHWYMAPICSAGVWASAVAAANTEAMNRVLGFIVLV